VPAFNRSESIEGLKIKGHSRDPLRSQPAKKINGIKCFLYKAEFDVFAEVIIELTCGTKKIYDNALVTKGEIIRCDTALISTIAKGRTPRLKEKITSHVTHTHGAIEWNPPEQANVKVITPRTEIINALQKRNAILNNGSILSI